MFLKTNILLYNNSKKSITELRKTIFTPLLILRQSQSFDQRDSPRNKVKLVLLELKCLVKQQQQPASHGNLVLSSLAFTLWIIAVKIQQTSKMLQANFLFGGGRWPFLSVCFPTLPSLEAHF